MTTKFHSGQRAYITWPSITLLILPPSTLPFAHSKKFMQAFLPQTRQAQPWCQLFCLQTAAHQFLHLPQVFAQFSPLQWVLAGPSYPDQALLIPLTWIYLFLFHNSYYHPMFYIIYILHLLLIFCLPLLKCKPGRAGIFFCLFMGVSEVPKTILGNSQVLYIC